MLHIGAHAAPERKLLFPAKRGMSLLWALSLHTCSQLRGDLKDKQNNKTTITRNEARPQIGLQATHQIV